jgi:hypothetical protein
MVLGDFVHRQTPITPASLTRALLWNQAAGDLDAGGERLKNRWIAWKIYRKVE